MVGDLGGEGILGEQGRYKSCVFCSYEYGSNYLQRIGAVGGGGT